MSIEGEDGQSLIIALLRMSEGMNRLEEEALALAGAVDRTVAGGGAGWDEDGREDIDAVAAGRSRVYETSRSCCCVIPPLARSRKGVESDSGSKFK